MDKQDFRPELNFITEFSLNRAGMINEITKELNTIRIGLSELQELKNEYSDEIDRIIVVPLRKLLCEKDSVLLKLCPDFKMMPLRGQVLTLDDKLILNSAPYSFSAPQEWIPLTEWLNTDIAFYTKDITDVPLSFRNSDFTSIVNKIRGREDKQDFQDLFRQEQLSCCGQMIDGYTALSSDKETKKKIFDHLKSIGYYNLSVYNYIKHIADKRGAHLDIGYSPFIQSINAPFSDSYINPIRCFAIQLIFAVREQLPELSDYWPDVEIPVT